MIYGVSSSSSFWSWSSSDAWASSWSRFQIARLARWHQNVMCLKPFRVGVAEYGCGQCLPCRVNRQRLWTTRLVLESTQHLASAFVTLTYMKEFLPEGGSLVPRHLQLYLKRLRKRIAPRLLRFYAVGEYGERRGRPHYHLCLFGVNSADAQDICEAWFDGDRSMGMVDIGDITLQSAAYCAKYSLKRLTKAGDARLHGRHPEFARMSLKGGIGVGAVSVIGDALTSKVGARAIARGGDVPAVVRLDGRLMPLGRYLRERVRLAAGFVKQKYARGDEPLNLYMLERQLAMREKGAFALQESRRVATSYKAKWIERFQHSKGKL